MITSLFQKVLALSIAGSLFYLLYLLLSFFFKKIFPAKWHRRVLSISLLFFLVPIGSFINKINGFSWFNSSFKTSENFSSSIGTVTVNPVAVTGVPVIPTNADSSIFQKALPYLAIFWFLGMVFFLFYQWRGSRRFHKKLINLSTPINDVSAQTIIDTLCREIKISKKIPLYECTALNTPLLTGLFHPFIVLPEKGLSRETLEFVLKHELTHYKSRDLWLKMGGEILCAVHWFNPLIWNLVEHLSDWIEKTCDANVVSDLPLEKRQNYAFTILTFLEEKGSLVVTTSTTTFSKNAKNMKERLSNIMENKKNGKKVFLFSTLLLVLLVTSGIFIAATTYRPEQEPATLLSGTDSVSATSDISVVPLPSQEVLTGSQSDISSTPSAETPSFAWPTTNTTVTDGYLSYPGHTGTDIIGLKGDPIFAAAKGQVVKVLYSKTGYGYHLMIDHGNGYQTLYGHCGTMSIGVGDYVEAGQIVATMGRTGVASATCLHFEVRKDGSPVDPSDFSYYENPTLIPESDTSSHTLSSNFEDTTPLDSFEKNSLFWPTQSEIITAEYGSYPGHEGMDIHGEKGDDIYAVADGKVITSINTTNFLGNYIVIDHGDYQTVYGMCDTLLVKEGDTVKTGQTIATMGSSGNSTGIHLHLEIHVDGHSINPRNSVFYKNLEESSK